jgi:hypothetical protein
MKIWRATFGYDNGMDGTGYHYATNRAEAEMVAKQTHDPSQLETWEVERMEVPTDRRGLIAYLNAEHSQCPA